MIRAKSRVPSILLGLFAAAPATAQHAWADPKPPAPAPAPPVATPTPTPTTATVGARWTAETPEAMVTQALARAGKNSEDSLAGLLVAAWLHDRVRPRLVPEGLDRLAAESGPLRGEAHWLSLVLEPAPAKAYAGLGAAAFDVAPHPEGMVNAFAILGPFPDTGGGLRAQHEPELSPSGFGDAKASYAQGALQVRLRRVLAASVTPRGVPLDLYVHPRTESCSYLASKITLPAGLTDAVVWVASTGAVRVMWDGANAAMDPALHTSLVLDRLAVSVPATAGEHALVVKVCSGSVGDQGRVRVRLTDAKGAPVVAKASSDLAGLVVPVAPALPPSSAPEPIPVPSAAANAKPGKPGSPGAPPAGAAKTPSPVGGPAGAPKSGPPVPAPAASPKPEPEAPGAVAGAGAKFKILRTPLARALAVDENASPARVLDAAIARTVAGADDAQSPRAPGLLDRAVQGAPESADLVAMAGALSSFGANRSAWLGAAAKLAATSGDKGAASFAARRLVEGMAQGAWPEWAHARTREPALALATDPEARLLKARAMVALEPGSLTKPAFDELMALGASLESRTPAAVWSWAASMAGGETRKELYARERLAAVSPGARDSAWVAAHAALGAAKLEEAAAHALAEQESADEVEAIAGRLLALGRYKWAAAAYELAVYLGPNREAAHRGRASALLALAATQGRTGSGAASTKSKAGQASAAEQARAWKARAFASLARARELAPGQASLSAELELRAARSQPASAKPAGPKPGEEPGEDPGQDGSDGAVAGTFTRDEKYMVAPAAFVARAKAKPAKVGEVFDRQLHWMRVVTYHPDRRVSQLMHYAREIVVEPKSEAELIEQGIPAEGDEVELLIARVHKKNGTVVGPDEQQTGEGRPAVRWPKLETGDIVEIAVRAWTGGPVGRRGDPPFFFIDYVGSTDTRPVIYNEVVVDEADGQRLAVDVLGGKADRVTSAREAGRTVTRYVWDQAPTVTDEPLAPKLSEVVPVIVGSSFASWNDFREWYRGAIAGFTEPDDQVRRIAAEITKGKKSRQEKLEAIFNFVADDIRYVNYVSGEWWLPNRPQQLLARRQGDCDDKAMLLISLLKSIGIEATPVLVQTRLTAEPSLLRSTKAAIPHFDHGIAYLPGENGKPGTWLDATSPESRMGPLPSMDARASALFIYQGDAKILETPASSPADHGTEGQYELRVDETGAAKIKAKERHLGDWAFLLRTQLGQADARAPWVEQNVAGQLFSAVSLAPEVTFTASGPGGAAELGWSATSLGAARREGGELAVPVGDLRGLTSQLAPLATRKLPVVMPPSLAPSHQSRKLTVVAPAGWAFAELPPGGAVDGGKFGRAKLTMKAGAKGTVVVEREITFDQSTIPVAEYPKWRAFLQSIDGLMNRSVRMVRVAGAKPAAAKTEAKPAPVDPEARLKASPTKTLPRAVPAGVAPKLKAKPNAK